MTDTDDDRDRPGQLADELEHEADTLEDRSQSLDKEIRGARQDWKSKRQDSSEPGAAPLDDEESRD